MSKSRSRFVSGSHVRWTALSSWKDHRQLRLGEKQWQSTGTAVTYLVVAHRDGIVDVVSDRLQPLVHRIKLLLSKRHLGGLLLLQILLLLEQVVGILLVLRGGMKALVSPVVY